LRGIGTDDFLKGLLATFAIEASEHLAAITDRLSALRKAADSANQTVLIEAAFRETHSLKGAARSVNLKVVEAVCQGMESVFAALKRGEMVLSDRLLDGLQQANDLLAQLIAAPSGDLDDFAADFQRVMSFLESGTGITFESVVPTTPPTFTTQSATQASVQATPVHLEPVDAATRPETVRISTVKLDSLLRQSEDLLASKVNALERLAELKELQAFAATGTRDWTRLTHHKSGRQTSRVGEHAPPGIRDPETLAGNLGGIIESQNEFLRTLSNRLSSAVKSAAHDAHALGSKVDALLDEVKSTSMLPASTVLDGFGRFARQLAQEQGKSVDLIVEGGDVHVDKRVLDEMKDAISHLVRNAVDHGIESTEVRLSNGKPARGKIVLTASPREGNQIEISVADDGSGIDPAAVRKALLASGVSQETVQSMDGNEIVNSIFESGLTTEQRITEISGRGLGLAIVREKTGALGGRVTVKSQVGLGTAFHLSLPLTMATLRGVLVRIGDSHFIIPNNNVERVARIREEDIRTIEGREAIIIQGRSVSLAQIGLVLGMARGDVSSDGDRDRSVVILQAEGRRIAFVVDALIREQEVLAKPLGRLLPHARFYSGAAIVGAGTVVPVLNPADLIHAALSNSGRSASESLSEGEQRRRQTVLVVEDSITSRTLLRAILEAAGYTVSTAVDGLDALTALQDSPFDLVVSDVDMPRMNGFELTTRIRAHKKMADLPVVLVTALESREDKTRGAEAGASAYLVKSSFDQSDLLETVRRLI
jgi:two-component system, chemotaxis family, sensor kinase CheA